MVIRSKWLSWSRLAVPILVAVAVAACVPAPPVAGPLDYSETHAIRPVATKFQLATRFDAGSDQLSYTDGLRLERFIREFLRRGRTDLVIATTPNAEGAKAQDNLAGLRARLVGAGVDGRRIVVRPGKMPLGDDASLLLSFGGYAMELPECGNWSGHTGYNPANLPHTDFGCSYQRNMGLMIADPGDLIGSGGDSYGDTGRQTGVIELYRAGAVTAAALPPSEIPGFGLGN
jgi:pilus biogenesis lipoprotein CpaD